MTLKINGATGGSVSLDAPDNTSPAGTDVTLTLPVNDGDAGQYLQTDGTGALSWQTVSAFDNIVEGNTTVECVDTGSNGEVRLTTENTRAMTVDSSQRVLVGTTTASGNNLLQVNSNISANGLNVGKNGSNIDIGSNNFGSLTTGSGNVCIGNNTGPDITSGYDNVIVGHPQGFGGWNVTTGYNNVFYGVRAGETVTDGAVNVCIGYYANPSSSSGSHQIVIGGRYGSTGKGNSTGFIDPNGGGVYQGNNSSSWSTTSDRRLKKNIVDNTEGLDVINQVRVVNFEYRLPEEIEQEDLQGQALVKRDENEEITGLQGVKLGVIAQELQQVCPDCVKEESSGVLGVVDDNLFWHLINAVKELSAKNASLETRLTALEGGAAQ